jgi:outer membrane biosynthesis protein TonB
VDASVVKPPEVEKHASGDDAGGRNPGGGLDAQLARVQAGAGAAPAAEGGAASMPVGRITVASKRALVESSLTAAMLLSKIQSGYMTGLKRCYRQRLAADPEAKGSVKIRLSVEPTGRTTGIEVTAFHPDLERCTKQSMQNWRFPVAKGADGEPILATFELALEYAAT